MEVDTVVCARTIPKHKAKLVQLVRSHNKVVLAIGDGANDVNMLTVGRLYLRKPTWVWAYTAKKACKLYRPVILHSRALNIYGNWFWFMGTGTTIGCPNSSTLSSTKTSSLHSPSSFLVSSPSSPVAQSTTESMIFLCQLGKCIQSDLH